MLLELYNLVFGKEEYYKTKIEDRFDQITILIPKINIEKLEDFDLLEKSIYKIKDLLRLKSSNLNKAIKNPNSALTHNKVFDTLENLEKVKYDFLKNAFSFLNREPIEMTTSETPEEEPETPREEPKEVDTSLFLSDSVEITLENGKVPYLKLKFRDEIDFPLLKYVSSALFETYNCQGTNIIVEGNIVLIIPRILDDNLITLGRVDSNLDEVFEKLKSSEEKDDYVEVSEVVDPLKHSNKIKEGSLDSLLGGLEEEKPRFTPKPKPREDTAEPRIIEAESIEVVKEEPKVETPKEETPSPKTYNGPLEVYRDDQIRVYLERNAKVFGQLVIESASGKSLEELEDNSLSYMFIFSKIFSSVLFDSLQAHGTNIIGDFGSNKITIVPRYQEDKLDFQWKAQEDSEEFLEQIKNKMLSVMHKEIANGEKKVTEVPTSKKEEKVKYLVDSLKRIP